ncbi:hypothetical protein [Candidatus Similichlamydia epinepheli]|uniref:hypothetical protein n=1 Tax=Candidatus Similichlamydia epinepheli TaxID=1903953 RepID=UPI0013009AB1|nr:hypothetical protein [Candidatus Similichlamydia epinepheli]
MTSYSDSTVSPIGKIEMQTITGKLGSGYNSLDGILEDGILEALKKGVKGADERIRLHYEYIDLSLKLINNSLDDLQQQTVNLRIEKQKLSNFLKRKMTPKMKNN